MGCYRMSFKKMIREAKKFKEPLAIDNTLKEMV